MVVARTDVKSIGKSKVINKAIQDIGMGAYQWQLFVLCGFGWLADKCVLLQFECLNLLMYVCDLVSGYR